MHGTMIKKKLNYLWKYKSIHTRKLGSFVKFR